jgi:hypothetical protein
MVQDVRSSAAGAVAFDLLSQAGVMQALAYVRGSTATTAEKRELRDLIFSYTNTGGDPAVRTLIENRLRTLTPAVDVVVTPADLPPTSTSVPVLVVTSTLTPSAVAVAKAPQLGSTRPAPVFAPVPVPAMSAAPVHVPGNHAQSSTAMATTVPSAPAQVIHVAEQPLTTASPFTPHNIPIVEMVAPQIESATVLPTVPVVARVPVVSSSVLPTDVPTPQREAMVAPTAPAPVAAPISVPVHETVPPSAPAVSMPAADVAAEADTASLDAYRARITAIKQMVNTRVGNPVNLVDLDGTLGRSYMSALLEAMKAVSGGSGSASEAMSKLEATVAQVLVLLDAKLPVVGVTAIAPEATPIPPSVTAPVPLPVVDAPSAWDTSEPVLEPSIEMPTSMPSAPVLPQTIPLSTESKTIISPIELQAARVKGMVAVGDVPPLRTPQDLPTAAEVKARSGITDPLMDPDVDAGLDQLLSEWALFKKSGIFGTGPKGRQHPLFIKMATLQVPLILSGRFEGATTEIRQSVTDYMNGWRYEQGILHENEETFEHYLRRVIRHIIDLQMKRRAS